MRQRSSKAATEQRDSTRMAFVIGFTSFRIWLLRTRSTADQHIDNLAGVGGCARGRPRRCGCLTGDVAGGTASTGLGSAEDYGNGVPSNPDINMHQSPSTTGDGHATFRKPSRRKKSILRSISSLRSRRRRDGPSPVRRQPVSNRGHRFQTADTSFKPWTPVSTRGHRAQPHW